MNQIIINLKILKIKLKFKIKKFKFLMFRSKIIFLLKNIINFNLITNILLNLNKNKLTLIRINFN